MPALVPTATTHAIAHITAAPNAPPSVTGRSNANNAPPENKPTGGAKITFTARRVRASSRNSRSQPEQRSPALN